MTIPVANIYYMLLYAWRRLDEHAVINIKPEAETDLSDLLARVLIQGLKHLLRRGLDREYVEHTEQLAGVRGKLEVAATTKTLALVSARTVCTFDSLDYNVLQNRILRTTLVQLLRHKALDAQLVEELSGLDRRLRELDLIELRAEHFHRVRLHRNNAFYGFLLDVCRFIFDEWFPSENDGDRQFERFQRDPKKMHALFEEFIRNFYAIRATGWRSGRRSFAWQAVEGSAADAAYLPSLNTDVTLVRGNHVLIIDAKYHEQTLKVFRNVERLSAANVNQMFAYMRNMALLEPAGQVVEGVLVYPAVDRQLDAVVWVHGHRLQARTLDLARPWTEIHERLLSFLPE